MKNIAQASNSIRIFASLVVNDYKSKYTGSSFGIFWGIIIPIVTILVYWFVFSVGFRSGNIDDGTPFVIWLTCGMVPWFFFSEAILSASNTYLEYSYLVKKMAFNLSKLLLVKVVSSVINHVVFLFILLLLLINYGYYPNIIYIQLLYYVACSVFLVIGLSYITSSLVVFVRDINHFISILIQIGFWLIPIVWSPELINDKYSKLFKLNPIYYIVEGFRDTLINDIWFWHRYNQTAYFWVFSIVLFIAGRFIFNKLKPHFADVL